MTRKDYEKIADVLLTYKVFGLGFAEPNTRIMAQGEIVSRMADMLAQDNPRFNRGKFIEACGCIS